MAQGRFVAKLVLSCACTDGTSLGAARWRVNLWG